MHELRRGDLYWLAEDDTHGPAAAYAHPHVVVQDDVFNRSRITTVIVCALSTNLHRATEPGNVLLDVGEGGLPRQSVVVVSRIASVDRARLGARVGALSDARVEQVLAGLRFQQASYFGARTNIRPEVLRLSSRGPFPGESEASDRELRDLQELLAAIRPPLSREEADLLLGNFGADDCFGGAWTLLHLLETTPGGAVKEAPPPEANEWIRRLWDRAHR